MRPVGVCPCGLVVLDRRHACSCRLVSQPPERATLASHYALAALAAVALWLLLEVAA